MYDIAEAAKMLDARKPDWHNRINVAVLEMDHYEKCILGQLFISYFHSDCFAFRRDHVGERYRVAFSGSDPIAKRVLWLKEIAARKGVDTASLQAAVEETKLALGKPVFFIYGNEVMQTYVDSINYKYKPGVEGDAEVVYSFKGFGTSTTIKGFRTVALLLEYLKNNVNVKHTA